jgi:hypothetical protein
MCAGPTTEGIHALVLRPLTIRSTIGVLSSARLHASRVPVSWFTWGGRGAFAVLDQACFAGSNFVASMLLARWFPPESYGAFAIAYSVLLLVGTLHTELLAAPMLVLGVSKYAERFRGYLGVLLLGHVWLMVPVSCLLGISAAVCWRFGSTALASSLAGVAVAAPFIFFLWLARTASYARFQPQWAAMGSAFYLAVLLLAMYGLHQVQSLTVLSVWVAMGVASLTVGLGVMLRHEPEWHQVTQSIFRDGALPNRRSPEITSGETGGDGTKDRMSDRLTVARDHLRYAKWSAGAGGIGWVAGNAHYFVLSSVAGLGSVAVMRVLDTALQPFFHYQAAISRLFVSAFGALTKKSELSFQSHVLRASLWWGFQALVAYIILRWFAARILLSLYGETYARHGAILAWYGLILVPEAVIGVLLSAFRALVRTELVFVYSLIFALSLLVAFIFAGRYGLEGVVSARVLLSFAFVPLMFVVARIVCGP